jgi:hypothetical protein
VVNDHHQAMVDLRSEVRNATRDQLVAVVLELVEAEEVNTDVHLLAMIMRGVSPRGRARHEFAADDYREWRSL